MEMGGNYRLVYRAEGRNGGSMGCNGRPLLSASVLEK